MTVEEILDELREVEVKYESDTELFGNENKNTYIPCS